MNPYITESRRGNYFGTNFSEQLTFPLAYVPPDILLPPWIFFIAPADVLVAIIKEIYAS